ncbi:transglutaminase [Siculibacillus lacustris]|uniref:Transglutaminase n=1 Tax=Siculibacillus lacustris TaxID=1549641 RepID=A0A4Q9VNY3_9HYPH|nr:transglutaminase-like cysteine peptidase [Siculibacillus lacustris]TBW36474.1 transglutaminase [Siculibacillus lacustris]
MNKRFLGFLMVLGFAVSMTTGVGAFPRIGDPTARQALPRAGALVDQSFTPAHYGFVNFCDRYGDQCSSDGKGSLAEMDGEKWSELVAVNNLVNQRIEPDRVGRDFEHWSLEATTGHCNEYAIQKRKELIDRGWPIGALSLAVVHTRFDEKNIFHLVLTVRTDRGDFVLDNLHRLVLPVNKTGYGWVMRQSTVHPRLWVSIGGRRETDI